MSADGESFELIASRLLLAELERALAYPKIRRRVSADEADGVIDWLRRGAVIAPDPEGPPRIKSRDPGDDYLLTLAAAESAMLVSGDEHLLTLRDEAPVYAPAAFLAMFDGSAP